MPEDILGLVNEFGLNMPKMCYMNGFLLVMQTLAKKDFDINYVLVEIEDTDGKIYPHAVVSSNGAFYDPTLEPQGLVESTKYVLIKEFSTEEIVNLMNAKFKPEQIKNMCDGNEAFWPLQQVGKNQFEFRDDGSPTIYLKPKSKQSSQKGLLDSIKSLLCFK
nr:TonB-dependent receptor, plug [Moritella viscosa]